MSSIKLITGLKTYDIEDENGNIRGQISFNPSDVNFYPRAQKVAKHIEDIIDSISHIEGDDVEIASIIEDCDNKIKSEINMLFGDDNTSNVVFGSQNCLNVLNGETFVERFLTAFMPIIEEETKKEVAKAQSRIDAYTKQVVK